MLDTDSQNIETAETAMTHAFAKAGYTIPGIDPEREDELREPRHYSSPTAAICDQAALFGATPGPDEIDNRFVWDADEALAGIEQAVHTLIESVAPDGTQLADERESLLWGFVNMLHAQVERIDRAVDRIVRQMRDLERAQDGSEVKAVELERLTDRAHDLGRRRDAFEKMRDFAAEAYRVETGQIWRPRRGSHTSRTGKLTSAAIDARDFRRARKDRETNAHLPDGTLVAITGGKNVADADAVWTTLDRAREKHGDMGAAARRRPGVREDRRELGGRARRQPGGVPPGLERPRQGRAVQAQRRAAEPAAEGRHRVPRQRHHREPGRQSPAARYSGNEHYPELGIMFIELSRVPRRGVLAAGYSA